MQNGAKRAKKSRNKLLPNNHAKNLSQLSGEIGYMYTKLDNPSISLTSDLATTTSASSAAAPDSDEEIVSLAPQCQKGRRDGVSRFGRPAYISEVVGGV